MRTSPAAARIMTVARKKCIGNGTPLRKPPGPVVVFHRACQQVERDLLRVSSGLRSLLAESVDRAS
jgi:hypothetical protein